MTRPDIEAVARAICAAHHEWHQSKSESDKDEYTARVVIQTLLSLGWQAPGAFMKTKIELSERLRGYAAADYAQGDGSMVKILIESADEIERLYSSVEQMRERCARVDTLFDAIAHGDEKHRAWLKAAIDAHFTGRVLPTTEVKPTGEGR